MRALAPVLAAAVLLGASACGDDEPTAAPSVAASPSSAAESDAPSAEPEQTAAAPAAEGARLTGEGIDLRDALVGFGTPYDQAATQLEGALGAPSKDTGDIDPAGGYGTCPGSTLRVLEYADGALQLLFGDVESDEPVLHTWALTNAGDPGLVPTASAFVGDVTSVDFGVGTTVGQLQEQVGEDVFQISEDELSLDPAFALADQSAGFRGFLTGTSPADTVSFVEAGTGCGE